MTGVDQTAGCLPRPTPLRACPLKPKVTARGRSICLVPSPPAPFIFHFVPLGERDGEDKGIRRQRHIRGERGRVRAGQGEARQRPGETSRCLRPSNPGNDAKGKAQQTPGRETVRFPVTALSDSNVQCSTKTSRGIQQQEHFKEKKYQRKMSLKDKSKYTGQRLFKMAVFKDV